MIEQNFLALTDQKKDNTLTRREWLGITLGLIGSGLIVLGHLKNKKESQPHNPHDGIKLIQKVDK